MLKGLTARGHRVTVFSPCQNAAEGAEASRVFPQSEYALHCFEYADRPQLQSKLTALRRPQSYIYSRELETALHRALREPYDILHLEQQWTGWLTFPPRPRTLVGLQSLFRLDCPTSAGGSLMDRLRYRRIRDAEAALLRRFPSFCALTAEMTDEVRSIHPQASVHTIPLGIDLENYPFDAIPTEDTQVVTMIGSFDWLPTRTATIRLLVRLWPAIHERVPFASLRIVGRHARKVLADYISVPGVTVEENVPDILPYFQQAAVLLYAPERGSGMKVKVLESFALGLPVVTTQSGVEGIPAVAGVHAGICEDDEGLIDACVSLLNDRAARLRQRTAARRLVERWCSSNVVLDALEDVYEEMLAQGRENVVA